MIHNRLAHVHQTTPQSLSLISSIETLREVQKELHQFDLESSLAWRKHPLNPLHQDVVNQVKDQFSRAQKVIETEVNNTMSQRSIAPILRGMQSLGGYFAQGALSSLEKSAHAFINSTLPQYNSKNEPVTDLIWSHLDLMIVGAGPVGLWTAFQILHQFKMLSKTIDTQKLPKPRIVIIEKRTGCDQAHHDQQKCYKSRRRIVHIAKSLGALIDTTQFDSSNLIGGQAIHDLQETLESYLKSSGGEDQIKILTDLNFTELQTSQPQTYNLDRLFQAGVWRDFTPQIVMGCDGRKSEVRQAMVRHSKVKIKKSEPTEIKLFHSLTLSLNIDPSKSRFDGRMKVLRVHQHQSLPEMLLNPLSELAHEFTGVASPDFSVLAAVNRKSKKQKSSAQEAKDQDLTQDINTEMVTVIFIFGDTLEHQDTVLPNNLKLETCVLRDLQTDAQSIFLEFLTELGATSLDLDTQLQYLPIDMYHTPLPILRALGELSSMSNQEFQAQENTHQLSSITSLCTAPSFLLGDACFGVPYQQALNHGFKTSYEFVSGLCAILVHAQSQSAHQALQINQVVSCISAFGTMYRDVVARQLREAFSDTSLKTRHIEWSKALPLLLDIHEAVLS